MKMADALAYLNNRFRYVADRGERWRIMRGIGVLRGDCEDYALTLIWLWQDHSMWRFWWALITFRAVLWHCTNHGSGHVVLWVRGHGWVDNVQKEFTPQKPVRCRLRFPWIAPLVALKFLLRTR